MNKATFDRRYKAIKGHMLDPVLVMATSDDPDVMTDLYVVQDIYWDEKLQRIIIEVRK